MNKFSFSDFDYPFKGASHRFSRLAIGRILAISSAGVVATFLLAGVASAEQTAENPEHRVLVLSGYTAETEGPPIRHQGGCLKSWHHVDSAAIWRITVEKPGPVEVQLVAAVNTDFAGSSFEVKVGNQVVRGHLHATDGWEKYETFSLGSVQVEPGDLVVRLQPTSLRNGVFGNIRAVRLVGIHVSQDAAKAEVNSAHPIKVFTTSRFEGDRIGHTASLEFQTQRSSDATTIVVDPTQRFQSIEGFGGAFTEAAGMVFSQLSPPRQEEVLKAYFDQQQGHGYRLCRTHINSCDFSRGNYAYSEVAGDVELEHFSIEPDRQYLIPLIHAAQKVAKDDTIKLVASPWSPPAWMKTNGKMTSGGKLKPEYRDVWARYYCRYVEEYGKENIPIWGLTVQNEPEAVQRWESCIYTAEEERDFVRDYLGPALHESGLQQLRLICWDHNRDRLFDRASTVFDDPEASKYVWGAGFHWYVSDDFHHVEMVNEFYPDKKLLFTEGCLEHGPHIGDWSAGEHYAKSIIHDLNHGAVGWMDWNILLNSQGGPNHVENYCSAPIIADVAKDKLIYNSSYYYLGHFARFIRPGFQRVLCGNTGEELLSTAFVGPDETIVVVILNLQEYPVRYNVKVDQRYAEAIISEHSIATVVLEKVVDRLAKQGE